MCAAEREVLSVTEVTRRLKLLIESEVPPLWIKGEASNVTHHSSGHLYFTLKDERAQIRAVMFRRYRTRAQVRLKDGMEIECWGRVGVYERGGNYELFVELLQPVGVGELELALAALKEKLAAEGLFETARKRPLPSHPTRIGVVTSATGAAVRDILRVLRRRFPATRVVLNPALVQGEGAPADIARGIKELNRFGEVDLIIVGRGGGSMEDLMAFNSEEVVRAMAGSRLPVVSAVGHETDVTLSDLAADLRAPTPSAAAELVVPDREDEWRRLADRRDSLGRLLTRRVRRERERFEELLRRYGMRRLPGILREWAHRSDELEARLGRALKARLGREKERVNSLFGRLSSLDPMAILARGYSVAVRTETGDAVRDSRELRPGEELRVVFHRGKADCRVERLLPGGNG